MPENGQWWDPFCGGLSMSVALAKHTGAPGLASDYCGPLITLYQAVADGWEPPTNLTKEEYDNARQLPDTDPLKAFAGFGCSFGGKWFGGYAGPRPKVRDYPASATRNALLRDVGKLSTGRNYAAESARALARDIEKLDNARVRFERLDFLAVEPEPRNLVIYCDPPYRDTTGYDATDDFDHSRFAQRCEQWAALGVPVFVSEYQINRPGWHCLWEHEHTTTLRNTGNGDKRTDRLYLVNP